MLSSIAVWLQEIINRRNDDLTPLQRGFAHKAKFAAKRSRATAYGVVLLVDNGELDDVDDISDDAGQPVTPAALSRVAAAANSDSGGAVAAELATEVA
jgi:hypothetical protein